MVFIFFLFVKCLASEPHVFGSGNDRSLRLLNRGEGVLRARLPCQTRAGISILENV